MKRVYLYLKVINAINMKNMTENMTFLFMFFHFMT